MSRLQPLHTAAETSTLVRTWRRVAAAAGRRRRAAYVPSRADIEMDALVDTVTGSRIARLIISTAGAFADAWRNARTAAIAAAATTAIAALDAVERARAVGVAIVAAALTNLLLTPLDPRPVSTARWSLWTAAMVLGGVAAMWPGHVAAAWIDWRSRRPRAGADRG